MRRVVVITLPIVLLGAVYLTVRMTSGNPGQAVREFVVPPLAVAVTTVQEQSWIPSIGATGSLRAIQGVNVTVQEAGMVTEIEFQSGQTVSKGALLLQQYDLDERFRLESLKAELGLARKNYERNQSLVTSKVGSQSQLDTAVSDLERLTADVRSLEALIEKRAIRAPFDGILGIRKVNIGQYIEPGDEIVSLQNLNPIYVDFPLPQNRLGEVAIGQTVQLNVDAWPGEDFAGTVTAMEPLIDPDTRSFQVEAKVPNPDMKLRPGMFAETRLILPADEKVLTLPQVAISHNPYGDSVFVIENTVNDNGERVLVAKSVFVTLGETRGDQVVILSGVKPGQQVVSAGQLRLRNGSQVTIDNRFEVANDPDPSVENN